MMYVNLVEIILPKIIDRFHTGFSNGVETEKTIHLDEWPACKEKDK